MGRKGEHRGDADRGGGKRERAVLVSVKWGKHDTEEAEESLQELTSLARTAGAEVAGTLLQFRDRPEPSTLLGKGKLAELRRLIGELRADLVIFDQDLTPSQQRNLENALSVKVIDRTALILDIFAIHAHSREGKAQVEMAQLRYALTRLAGRGEELSRLGGGIGTRGPGETKLEVDRRRINERIRTLNRTLKDLERIRRTKRKRRERGGVPTFSLVGYTNSGKSSLLNALTAASVLVENQLFSTLDPVTRRVRLPGNREAVLTDTVGFINHLPHQLVEAFKSTLEEVRDSDVLLHVIDGSARDVEGRIKAVDEVLEEIGAENIPTIYVVNKVDLLDGERRADISRLLPRAVFTSTLTGEGLEDLKSEMAAALSPSRIVHLRLPEGEEEVLARIFSRGRVLEYSFSGNHHVLTAELPPAAADRLSAFTAGKIDRPDGESGTGKEKARKKEKGDEGERRDEDKEKGESG
jgi:GTP-binding protein HflX